MAIFRTNGQSEFCGIAVGILCMDEYLPFAPGDVNNARSYDYPVRYHLVPGWHSKDVVSGRYEFLDVMIEKARELERSGVRAITSNCGYAIAVQDAVANAVNIPVGLSPLVQLPLIASSLAPNRPIGVMAAAAPPMSTEFIAAAGIDINNPIAVYGLQEEPGMLELLRACGVGSDGDSQHPKDQVLLDTESMTADMVSVAKKMVRDHPDMGALVFECSMFPPYAKAVQDAVKLPVFDAITLTDFLFKSVCPKRYEGFM